MVILLDDDHDLGSKLAEEGLRRSRSPSPNPPPAYAPRGADPRYEETAPLLGYAPRPGKGGIYRGQSAARRLCRAYVWVVLLFCLLWVLYQSLSATGPQHADEEVLARPTPADGEELRCIQGADYFWDDHFSSGDAPELPSALSSFTIPISNLSNSLRIYSRGSSASGSIEILPSFHHDNAAIVLVAAPHRSKDVLMQSSICLLRSEVGQVDLGIFTPDRWSQAMSKEHIPQHHITVLLPIIADGYIPFPLDKFATNLPGFSHRVGDLGRSVDISSVSLKSSDAPILIESLYARNISLATSHANITGRINVADNVELYSPHGDTDVEVDIKYAPFDIPSEHLIYGNGGNFEARVKVVDIHEPRTEFINDYAVIAYMTSGPLEVICEDCDSFKVQLETRPPGNSPDVLPMPLPLPRSSDENSLHS
ncbi:hypothetical protein PUNSTDRAFT_143413 [Punctularia strigosozonata HHB-11173 SS5]|uniref:uncharacterized protein n=1 Tax=Punctularia strigosozonata (strain HHB-11173) TaxID=741275 RepID=UPI0004417611|nr:uncharacterized protein PUNSTDRAFT_143413 [Punctularia strigosozonata HHB-11173 SS5]EIN10083.1 hypothetical protein PUNSTDRAFT_143413 [Punctularia strigosozonata HHB-11173 SS5]